MEININQQTENPLLKGKEYISTALTRVNQPKVLK
jgi:ribosomal protein S24E